MTDETIYPWEYENRVYKIYLGDNHTYSLMEEDEWDEFHKEWIVRNCSLAEIFINLDIRGIRDKLNNLETWLENIEEEGL